MALIVSPADVAIRERRTIEASTVSGCCALAERDRIRRGTAAGTSMFWRKRNATLRAGQSASVIRAWDEPLTRSAATVMTARFSWVEEWRDAFRGYYEAVSGGPSASMQYVPSVSTESWDEVSASLAHREALEASWARDVRVRNTGVGPNRDELLLSLIDGGRAVKFREFGSGETAQDGAALALRFVEGDAIRRTRRTDPVLLLDDAFAELDDERRERALRLLEGGRFGQVILTAPKESDIPLQGGGIPRWGIRDGRIFE